MGKNQTDQNKREAKQETTKQHTQKGDKTNNTFTTTHIMIEVLFPVKI